MVGFQATYSAASVKQIGNSCPEDTLLAVKHTPLTPQLCSCGNRALPSMNSGSQAADRHGQPSYQGTKTTHMPEIITAKNLGLLFVHRRQQKAMGRNLGPLSSSSTDLYLAELYLELFMFQL